MPQLGPAVTKLAEPPRGGYEHAVMGCFSRWVCRMIRVELAWCLPGAVLRRLLLASNCALDTSPVAVPKMTALLRASRTPFMGMSHGGFSNAPVCFHTRHEFGPSVVRRSYTSHYGEGISTRLQQPLRRAASTARLHSSINGSSARMESTVGTVANEDGSQVTSDANLPDCVFHVGLQRRALVHTEHRLISITR